MLILSFLFVRNILKDRNIEVKVNAKWKKPLPFSEAVNFFNEFYPEGYECMIEKVNSASAIPTSEEESVEFLGECLPPFEKRMLSYLMKWHYFSPRVAFYSNLKDHNTKFEFEPDFECSQFVDFSLRSELKKKCIVRPVLPRGASEYDSLRGYGVELRPFKYSMEYGVKDSASVFNSTVRDHTDETREYLDSLEDLIGKQPSGRRLRRAFFSFLSEIDDEKRIQVLRDITHNWPATASYVAATEIDEDVESALEDGPEEIPPGMNSVVMNGRIVPISTFDPFTFAAMIREETTLRNTLSEKLLLSNPSINLLTQMESSKPTLSFDIRKGPIIWINDLENDRRYKKWSTKLSSLFGNLKAPPRIRRNLINAVFVIDPAFPKDYQALMMAKKFISQGYAVRFGVILAPHKSSPESLRINQGLSDVDPSLFYQFLSKVDTNASTIEESFAAAYEKTMNRTWGEFREQSNDFCEKQTSWIASSGLSAPSMWINGAIYQGTDVFELLEYNVMQSLQLVRDLIGTPDFKGDVLDFVLTKLKAAPKKVNAIHSDAPVCIDILKMKQADQVAVATDLLEMNYDLEDSEFPLATAWIHCRKNREQVEDKIRAFFESEHKTPVRIAFLEQLPKGLGKVIEANDLVDQDYEAIVIVNGRILTIDSTFDDFGILFDWQASSEIASHFISKREISYAKQVTEKHRRDSYTFWMMTQLSFEVNEVRRRHFHPNTFDLENPAVVVSECEGARISLECILDPFSKEFQKMIGFIAAVEHLHLIDISILLNPPEKLASVPSSFYRYVSDEYGVFSFLNESITYSVIPEIPESWMIEQSVADVDLDNILGAEMNKGTFRAYYELSNIVLEGSALDQSNKNCDGAQIQLFENNKFLTDTIVMKNKGYWQLKSHPGLFHIDTAKGWTSSNFQLVERTATPVVASFVWKSHLLKFKRFANFSALRDDNSRDDGKIHIFAVASGRLYERLAKIMMLSAIKNGNTTVKVWLFKNFLSPQMKQTLPQMCELYNMEYELVTYRWPHWLRRQTEKQRTTWGNKILFLDVLFPLNLKRVIYVDADQTIRTNMRQLMTMDFNGAPYAFTPFCDSRAETEPYRFWKTGYWKDHLKGKKYHISALFAIDLKRFREMSAGDWLRYYYSQLAGDSGSLANLDQDLPNYAQDKIPIYSLPQNWLWCETWCSDDTMAEARTIDLCNNPLTKRPKLEIAQTRIKEWPALDEEVRRIEENAVLKSEL